MVFTGWSNEGIGTFANSLSNLGSTIGNAFAKQQERQLLSDIGNKIQSGDLRGAADMAFKSGDTSTGVNLLKLVQDQDKLKAQTAADANVMNYVNGVSPMASSGQPMNIQSAILAQESGNNPNVGTSIDGARGVGQIMPATFARFAKPGENINNPDDNRAVSGRILNTYMQKYNDPARAAVAYFSGEGNVAPPGSPTPWKRDTHDGNNKYVSSYVSDIMGRLGGGQKQPFQVADASGAIPQSANTDGLMAKRNSIMNALSNQSISDNARQQLKIMLDDTTFQIQRADTKAANVPEFQKKNEGKMADRFDALVTQGDSARTKGVLIDQLDELGRTFDTGGAAAAQAWLADKGVNVGKNVDKIQAYQAIVNQLIPMQRAPGSGSTSDFDARGFMASLPGLMKTPEGNQRIIDTLKGLNQYQLEMAGVAERVQIGELSAAEGVKALRNIKASDFIKKNSESSGSQGFNVRANDQIPGSQPTMQSGSFQKSNANIPQGFNSDLADFQRAVALHPERKDEFLSRLQGKYGNSPELMSRIK